MKRILNRVKRFFNADLSMSVDRPRAKRMVNRQAKEHLATKVRSRAARTESLQKMKTCNNSHAPDHWPSQDDKSYQPKTKPPWPWATRKNTSGGGRRAQPSNLGTPVARHVHL